MSFTRLSDIVAKAETSGRAFWEIVRDEDCQEEDLTAEASFEKMRGMLRAMRAADGSYDGSLKSASNLSGGDGAKMAAYRENHVPLTGPFLSLVMEKALKMGESNACMRRIVAAPTAGSCGVISAVLLTCMEQGKGAEDDMVKALYVAGGIGEVLAASASIAGAEGGCQAEIGSAAAMAAGALTALLGGSPEMIINAAALALKSLLGLTCDPVGGLVEVPCIKRNASGAAIAVVAAEMTLAGIKTQIPPDEVVDAMRRIGRLLPTSLRETGQEGLATCPSAMKIAKRIVGAK